MGGHSLRTIGTQLAFEHSMWRTYRPHALFVAFIAAAACSPLPKVNLQAGPADLEVLAGEWVGEYESASLGRSGSLEFRLVPGTNEARGAVLMVPRGQLHPYQRAAKENADVPAPDPFNTEMLSIRFIRASHGSIVGMLDRYWDPDRQCYATTVFTGEAGETAVAGTFKTSFSCGEPSATGRWHAARNPTRR